MRLFPYVGVCEEGGFKVSMLNASNPILGPVLLIIQHWVTHIDDMSHLC